MVDLPDRVPDTLALDLETCDPHLQTRGPGWAFGNEGGHVAGVAVAWQGYRDYIGIGHEAGGNVDSEPVVRWLQHILSDPDLNLILANGNYDIGWLRWLGVPVRCRVHDVLVQCPLLDEYRRRYDLDSVALDYLGVGKDTEHLMEVGRRYGLKTEKQVRAGMWRFHAEDVRPYAEQDAQVTLDLWKKFMPMIQDEQLEAVYRLEMDLLPVLLDMRWRGVRVDLDRAEQVKDQLKEEEDKALEEIFRRTSVRMSASDSKSAGPVLRAIGVEVAKTPKSGQDQVTKEWLEELPGEVPELIRTAREAFKARSTFIENSILKHHHHGRIHAEFLSVKGESGGTVGGRFCVRKGSKVMIPGGTKPIEEVVPGDLVYSYDEDHRLCLRKVSWSGKTGHMPLVRIHWQGTGRQHEGYLDVTENHEVLCWEGIYIPAKELRVGESILSLHRETKKPHGYNILYSSKNPEVGREGRFVFQEVYGWVPEEVHHKNHVRSDDRPENLQGLTVTEHRELHGRNMSPETKEKMSTASRKAWEENYEYKKASCPRGKDHSLFVNLSGEEIIEALIAEKGRPVYAAKRLGIYFGTLTEKCEALGVDRLSYLKRFNAAGEEITLEKVEEARRIHVQKGVATACQYLRIGHQRWDRIQEDFGFEILERRRPGGPKRENHFVTAVEYLDECDDVYDIEVEDTHNFIAEELCVHNSSRNPNMQQIPARNPVLAPLIRGLFLPEPGDKWASLDYSSQEPRLTVHYAVVKGARRGQVVANQYIEDPRTDYHQLVADLCGIDRKKAKTINLGLAYGMGGAKLCHSLGLPTNWKELPNGKWIEIPGEEGQAILDQYHSSVPYIQELSRRAKRSGEKHGYVRTILGRKCRFPMRGGQRWFTHKALNRVIQGSAADQMKKAMVDMYRDGILPLVSVHDEVCLSGPDEAYFNRAAEIMRHTLELELPFPVDIAIGNTWGEALD